MKPIRFHAEVRAEVLAVGDWYENEELGLRREFAGEVALALKRVQAQPDLHREVEGGVRKCRVTRFPYALLYRVGESEIEIVAVMHLHREPGYWRIRL